MSLPLQEDYQFVWECCSLDAYGLGSPFPTIALALPPIFGIPGEVSHVDDNFDYRMVALSVSLTPCSLIGPDFDEYL